MRFVIRKPIKQNLKKKNTSLERAVCVLDNLFVTCEQAVCVCSVHSELRLFYSNMCLNLFIEQKKQKPTINEINKIVECTLLVNHSARVVFDWQFA